MTVLRKLIRYAVTTAILASATLPGVTARAEGVFEPHSLDGPFVLSFHGAFTSVTPFGPDPVQLETSMIGLLEFDGAGLAWGELTLAFHDESIPVGVRSRKALLATYTVEPNGHATIAVDEYDLDEAGHVGPAPTNALTIECYIVKRRRAAQCLLHSLVSFQLGPGAVPLPATLSGTLRRQR